MKMMSHIQAGGYSELWMRFLVKSLSVAGFKLTIGLGCWAIRVRQSSQDLQRYIKSAML